MERKKLSFVLMILILNKIKFHFFFFFNRRLFSLKIKKQNGMNEKIVKVNLPGRKFFAD